MIDHEMPDCPIWVNDEKAITHLLALLLDKLDHNVKPILRVTRKRLPELYAFNESDTQYLWSLIQTLKTKYGVLIIALKPFMAGREVYEDAQIRLNTGKENLIRKWLNRPRKLSTKEMWASAAGKMQWDSHAQKQFILNNPLIYQGKSEDKMLIALQSMKSTLLAPVTLRALSSRHFWGDSKFLDNRAEYLESLYPTLSSNIQTRQLLVNAYIPEMLSTVIFIENQDTFLQLVSYIRNNINICACLNNVALIYSAGYRGAATRIRHEGVTSFSLMSTVNPHIFDDFVDWWEKRKDNNYHVFFWGDLDYSGLGILASLRSTFPGARAWKPGFNPMVQYHTKGVSHTKSSAKKENQIDPGFIGCEYADTILLPIIRENEYFVDQEVVSMSDLEVADY